MISPLEMGLGGIRELCRELGYVLVNVRKYRVFAIILVYTVVLKIT